MQSIRDIHAIEQLVIATNQALRTFALIGENEPLSSEACDCLGTLAVNLRLLATECQATAEACDQARKFNKHGRFAMEGSN